MFVQPDAPMNMNNNTQHTQHTNNSNKTSEDGSLSDFMTGRDRGLTFGSDFDFSFPDNGGSVDGMGGPLPATTSSIVADRAVSTDTIATTVSNNTTNTVTSVKPSGISKLFSSQGINQVYALQEPLLFNPVKQSPDNNIIKFRTTIDASKHSLETHPQNVISIEDQTDDNGTTSMGGFMDGMFSAKANGKITQHTPPSNLATSYEAKHFGKRMRAGSISGRLRSASNLEDIGLIDKEQKGVLKDLIISGDVDLEDALDQFESGNSSKLKNLIKKGALLQEKVADIDLLDDLDLDFLNVNDALSGNMNIETNGQQRRTRTHRNSFVEIKNAIEGSKQDDIMKIAQGASIPSEYDDIGELDFNEDYGAGGYLDDLSDSRTSNEREPGNVLNLKPEYVISQQTIENSELQQQRNRSDTFGSLLGDSSLIRGVGDRRDSFGRWMDGAVSIGSLDGIIDQNLLNEANNESSIYDRINIVTPIVKTETEEEQATLQIQAQPSAQKPTKRGRKKNSSTKDKDSKSNTTERKLSKQSEKNKAKDLKNAATSEPKEIIHGLGRPRSQSDPNIVTTKGADGLLHVERPDGWIGAYSPESRKVRIDRFMEKRNKRVWTKKVKYDVRKNFADSRLRVKGRFVKKEDEMLMRDLLSMT